MNYLYLSIGYKIKIFDSLYILLVGPGDLDESLLCTRTH